MRSWLQWVYDWSHLKGGVCAPHKGQQLSRSIVLPCCLSKPGAWWPQQFSPPQSSEVRGVCLWPAWLFMWVLEIWSLHAFRARALARWGISTAPSLVFKGLTALNQGSRKEWQCQRRKCIFKEQWQETTFLKNGMVGAQGIGESEDKGEHTGLQSDRWPVWGCSVYQISTKDFYQSGRDRVEHMTMLNAQGVMVRVLPKKGL